MGEHKKGVDRDWEENSRTSLRPKCDLSLSLSVCVCVCYKLLMTQIVYYVTCELIQRKKKLESEIHIV